MAGKRKVRFKARVDEYYSRTGTGFSIELPKKQEWRDREKVIVSVERQQPKRERE